MIVLVDAAATGHVVAQMGAPEAIRDLVSVGPIRSQTEWMTDLHVGAITHQHVTRA